LPRYEISPREREDEERRDADEFDAAPRKHEDEGFEAYLYAGAPGRQEDE
jgi:hypothetical protein